MQLHRFSNSLTIQTPAKLNLFFEILGKRSDSWHEIETVTVPVDLYDELTFSKNETGSGVEFSGQSEIQEENPVPFDETNLVMKAVRLFEQIGNRKLSLSIRLTKRIPSQAGLGGGSSDAAAVLVGLNELEQTGYTRKQLQLMAGKLGSDVPLFLEPGGAFGWGRGEHTCSLDYIPEMNFVILKPREGLSTPAVYEQYSRLSDKTPRPINDMLRAIQLQSPELIGCCLFNRLEQPAVQLWKELGGYKSLLRPLPGVLGVQMSGSGTAVFALCRTVEAAQNVFDSLTRLILPVQLFIAKTCQSDWYAH